MPLMGKSLPVHGMPLLIDLVASSFDVWHELC
jgi:hypothetical protein